MWESVKPILFSPNAKSIVSTSGTKLLKADEHNTFAEMWYHAMKGSGQKATLLKWNDFPGRGEEFKRYIIGLLGEEAWRREYECEFVFESEA
jgi:hypothetical protein